MTSFKIILLGVLFNNYFSSQANNSTIAIKTIDEKKDIEIIDDLLSFLKPEDQITLSQYKPYLSLQIKHFNQYISYLYFIQSIYQKKKIMKK